MRKFAVFDIDGTLIRWQLYHAVSDALVKLGYVSSDEFNVVRNARMEWKRRTGSGSFKSYEEQLITTYEQVLKHLSMKQIMDAADAVFDEYKDQVYTYPRSLIAQLKDKDYLLFAISGSQVEIVEKIARHWGFDEWVGTVYEYDGERFTGRKTLGSANKAGTLEALVKKHSAVLENSVAVGDSASDISMLEMVQQPIAFNPDKQLFGQAQDKGWKVVIERKNMVYELEKQNGQYGLAKAS